MRDLISGEAELDDEEDDESFDDETGEERRKKKPAAHIDDSSEEEEDDDDEEEARKVTPQRFPPPIRLSTNALDCIRSVKVLSSMRTKKRRRWSLTSTAGRLRESGSIEIVKKKRRSMRKIWSSLASNSENNQNPRLQLVSYFPRRVE